MKYFVTDRVPCYVDFAYEVEADSEDEAMQKYRNGETTCKDPPRVMDAIDYIPCEITIEPERATGEV